MIEDIGKRRSARIKNTKNRRGLLRNSSGRERKTACSLSTKLLTAKLLRRKLLRNQRAVGIRVRGRMSIHLDTDPAVRESEERVRARSGRFENGMRME